MSRFRLLSLSTLVGALLLLFVPPAGAQAAPTQLVAVRAAHHPGFDRVTFEFRGSLPSSRSVRYVPSVTADGSGAPVPVAGAAVLEVVLGGTNAHGPAGGTLPSRVAYALPEVLTTVHTGDFEAVTSYAIGLAVRSPVHTSVLSRPSRFVVDIVAAFRTVDRRVWFLDAPRYVAGTPPYFRAVTRSVPAAAPAAGVLHRLYAGPTPAEQRAGLRALLSRSTSFRGLAVRDGGASVQLVGGCSSGGATVSIASEILPALHQFPRVAGVKVRDPRGRTEHPAGRGDSIPACLEP